MPELISPPIPNDDPACHCMIGAGKPELRRYVAIAAGTPVEITVLIDRECPYHGGIARALAVSLVQGTDLEVQNGEGPALADRVKALERECHRLDYVSSCLLIALAATGHTHGQDPGPKEKIEIFEKQIAKAREYLGMGGS